MHWSLLTAMHNTSPTCQCVGSSQLMPVAESAVVAMHWAAKAVQILATFVDSPRLHLIWWHCLGWLKFLNTTSLPSWKQAGLARHDSDHTHLVLVLDRLNLFSSLLSSLLPLWSSVSSALYLIQSHVKCGSNNAWQAWRTQKASLCQILPGYKTATLKGAAILRTKAGHDMQQLCISLCMLH